LSRIEPIIEPPAYRPHTVAAGPWSESLTIESLLTWAPPLRPRPMATRADLRRAVEFLSRFAPKDDGALSLSVSMPRRGMGTSSRAHTTNDAAKGMPTGMTAFSNHTSTSDGNAHAGSAKRITGDAVLGELAPGQWSSPIRVSHDDLLAVQSPATRAGCPALSDSHSRVLAVRVSLDDMGMVDATQNSCSNRRRGHVHRPHASRAELLAQLPLPPENGPRTVVVGLRRSSSARHHSRPGEDRTERWSSDSDGRARRASSSARTSRSGRRTWLVSRGGDVADDERRAEIAERLWQGPYGRLELVSIDKGAACAFIRAHHAT